MFTAVRYWFGILILASLVSAQTFTGSIAGTVVDPSGQVIVGADVTLVNAETGESRSTTTNESGTFTFPAVHPGNWTVRVMAKGFAPLQRTGNALSANERLSTGTLQLTVGSVTETVTVSAEGAAVQIQSSETSALLTSRQLDSVAIRGRDVISMLRILPGVAQQVDTDVLGGNFGTGTPNIQGTRSTWNTVSVDGITGNDLGSPNTFGTPINLDAIGEVKVLLNNYQAEYGRNGGATVNIITKSGSKEFHGSLYGYKRHDSFNANNFFSNRNGLPRPIYRHSTLGASVGGPVMIPGILERTREKLFFFYSFEKLSLKDPQAVRQVTTPTQQERAGLFSIPIRDPLANANFPGNQVPQSRIDANGLAILNIFPLPNRLDTNLTRGQYNYDVQEVLERPKRQHLFRIDHRPNSKDAISVRGNTWYADSAGWAVAAGSSNWGLVKQHYTYTDQGISLSYVRIVSPTLVNEFIGGVHHSTEDGPPVSQEELDRVIRSKRGITFGQLYPEANSLNIIPQASFGGVVNPAAITYDGRFPLRGADTGFNFGDNLSWRRGAHDIKFGFSAERLRNYEGAQGTYGGNFDFGRDANNPIDSGWAYSNALLGVFRSYTESSSRPSNEGRKTDLGWFVQDNWKVTRRFTLDVGIRFTWYTQWVQATGRAGSFALDRYDAAKAPRFFVPVRVGTQRLAQNPITGQTFPIAYLGALIPGTGDPINGAVSAKDTSYPKGFAEQQPMLPEPRLGFAWDVFGNGKTAVRGSFGVFHNTVAPGVRAFTQNPPEQFNPRIIDGTLATFLSTTGVNFPSTIRSIERKLKTPSIYSYTLGVQRDVGWKTVMDVAYVGSVSRHLAQTRNINAIPYGVRFLPQNADPSNPTSPLPDNFFRPFPGWDSITYQENAGTANYNALQIAVNRRFVRGFQFGVGYTWSKTMDYVDGDGDGVAMYRPVRIWNYGKAGFDQTHVFVLNYTWDLPKASRVMPNPVTRWVLDGWTLSGITTFASGFPSGVGFSTVDSTDSTGGGDGQRIIVTGKAALPKDQQAFSRFFDTSVFRRPGRGDFGNAPKDVIRLPGSNNWDISAFKEFPIGSERRVIQLRWETYNTFNHTQFSSVDTSARFDAAGGQTNARFGEFTGARSPRVMQGSVRFRF